MAGRKEWQAQNFVIPDFKFCFIGELTALIMMQIFCMSGLERRSEETTSATMFSGTNLSNRQPFRFALDGEGFWCAR